MKKEVFITMLWVFIGIVWFGVHQLTSYLVEMQYATNVAPKQVEDDAAYTAIKSHHTVIELIDYVYFAGFLVIVFFIAMIWTKRSRTKLIVE
jgi:hypothetical protein